MPSAALVPPILTGTDNVSGNFLRSATRLESAGGLDGPAAPKHRLLSRHCNRRFAELTAGSAPVFEELADADDGAADFAFYNSATGLSQVPPRTSSIPCSMLCPNFWVSSHAGRRRHYWRAALLRPGHSSWRRATGFVLRSR
jgi:hypothetical protein